MEQNLPATLSLLEHTPATLNSLLRDLSDCWTQANEGPDTWTAEDVVRHLIKSERENWIPRILHLLEHGERVPFPPFQRQANPDPDLKPTLAEFLDTFAALRSQSLTSLRALNLQPEQMSERAIHPTFGQVTLSQLLATWTTHDLTHLHQISRILAYQYRDAVGPWSAFLGVLHCDGHSVKG